MPDVTQIFSQIEQGHRSAAEQLLPLVYEEQRELAATKMSNEKPGFRHSEFPAKLTHNQIR